MENMINIKSNWKHCSLEHLIKRFDTAQDLSRGAMLFRMIRAADKVQDWRSIKGMLSKVERLEEAPAFSNFQAKYDDEIAEVLERVKEKILLDLKDDSLKVLQTQYLLQLLQLNYLEDLKKEALVLRAEGQVDINDIDAPELVKLLVEIILIDKNSDAISQIKTILVDWRNNR
ncbi:MAG: hypothetical protein WDZ91_16920 [Paenibacillaceae bacterium]